jgi:D-beta-D-heptose 7-phosphate kinase/D-beta-D-heptose 1-phosphate adenosyltransferase
MAYKEMKKTIVIASGYFNPLHKGHIEYLERASELGDSLFVIINNDEQVKLKGSKLFMDYQERATIVNALGCVNGVVVSVDKDLTVCRTIEIIVLMDRIEKPKFIFAKGGDKTSKNIPEKEVCKKLGIQIIDGLGNKIQSSSELLKKI